MMDGYLEDSYQSWKHRQRVKGDIVKKRRRRMGDAGELRWGGCRVKRLLVSITGPPLLTHGGVMHQDCVLRGALPADHVTAGMQYAVPW
jgi:hypothetical protein